MGDFITRRSQDLPKYGPKQFGLYGHIVRLAGPEFLGPLVCNVFFAYASSTSYYLFNLYSILCFTNLHRYLCFDILQVEQMRLRQSRNMRDCI